MKPLLVFAATVGLGCSAVAQRPTIYQARTALEIQGDGPTYVFNRVSGLIGLPSGGSAVLSTDARSVLVFDAAGRHVKSFGGNGSGPGEFRNPGMMGQIGDSLWVWDRSLSRVTVFTLDGAMVRTIPVTVSGDGVLFRDGAVGIFTIRRYSGPFGQPDSLSVWRQPPGGSPPEPQSRIFNIYAPHRLLRYPIGGRQVVGRQPFDDETLMVTASNGSGFAVIDRAVPARGPKLSVGIRRFDHRGRLIFEHRVAVDAIPLGSAEVDDAIRQLQRGTTDPQLTSVIRQALFVPKFLPPVSSALLGRDGTVWLRMAQRTDATLQRWLVTGSRGEPLQEVLADKHFWPVDANGLTVWGLVLNEDQAVSVRKVSLEARSVP